MDNNKISSDDKNEYDNWIKLEDHSTTPSGKGITNIYLKCPDEIGKGGFSKCYKCIKKPDKTVYAVKEISKFLISKQRAKERLKEEIEIHQSLNHDNIVKYKTRFEDDYNIYMILELCENGDLHSLLKTRKKLKEIEVQYYIIQLINALKYLHEKKKIVHRDLKLANILLSIKMELKLCDFGLATKFQYLDNKEVGTKPYMAPEIYKKQQISDKVDIWALGIIIYNLIIGKTPLETEQDIKCYNNDLKFPSDAIISKAAKDLIRQILVKDPAKRPTLDQILTHDFFHLGERIPKLLPVIFKEKEPTPSYILFFMKDANEKDIVDREVIKTNLIGEYIPPKNKELDNKNNNNDDNIFVTKYIDDYKDMYGIGYKLNNNNFGAYFRDSSKMLCNPKTGKVYYIYRDENGELKEEFYDEKNFKDKDNQNISHNINKKWKILEIFNRKMDETNYTSNSTYTENDENNANNIDEEINSNKSEIYVKKYHKLQNIILFRLSNHKIQVNFKHHEIIIISSKNKEIIQLKKYNGRTKRYSYPFDLVGEIPDGDLRDKLIFIQNLFKKIKNDREKNQIYI